MSGNLSITAAALLAASLATGCATVPREAGFPDVQRTVAERTGRQVHWNQGSASDAAVASQVQTMLGKELAVDEAVQVALLNNRGLQATYESLMISQADLVEAGLLRNPVFDAEIRFAEVNGHVGMELALVQDFIDILYIPLRKRLAEAAFEAAKLRVTGEVVDLAGDVRAGYYNLQAAVQLLEMRRQVADATEATYDVAKRLRAAGNITELELFNERAVFEQAKLDLRSSELQVFRARERLNVLMGLWGNQTNWTVAKRLPPVPADEIAPEGIERRALERSLDLAIARQEVEQAGRALGIARPLAFFPEAEVGVAAEREPDGEWAVGPAFSLPLPIFNQGQPGVAAAQAELRGAAERYAATAVTLRSQARSIHATLLAAKDQANYYSTVVLPLRQRIVEQTQLQYNAMQVSPFQLLVAKQEQIEAGAAYIGALRDYWLTRTQFDQLLSGRMASFEQSETETQTSSSAGSGRGGGH